MSSHKGHGEGMHEVQRAAAKRRKGIGHVLADGHDAASCAQCIGDAAVRAFALRVAAELRSGNTATALRMLDAGSVQDAFDTLEALQSVIDAENAWRRAQVPADFPVKVLTTDMERSTAKDLCTCGTCGRSWDNAVSTDYTPAPSARCPFEYYH